MPGWQRTRIQAWARIVPSGPAVRPGPGAQAGPLPFAGPTGPSDTGTLSLAVCRDRGRRSRPRQVTVRRRCLIMIY